MIVKMVIRGGGIHNILDFQISHGSVATYCRRGRNLCRVYREFSYESVVERILKINSQLIKLLSKN